MVRPGLVARLSLQAGPHNVEVELDAGEGETVALVGPNGAGKTTIVRAIVGLVTVGTGSHVAIDGTVLDDPERAVFVPPERRPIATVFQDTALLPHLDAVNNVAFGLRHRRGLRRPKARRVARGWLERLGVPDIAHLVPAQLSGGEAQRVALARALAVDARLLLLDEPLAALDAQARVALRRLLRRQLVEAGGARVLVTHDPVDAMALADRVVVLEEGRVVQQGTPHELARRPRSQYVADLVGLNLFRGTARDGVVTLPGGGTLVVAAPLTGEVLAVAHPRAVSLHAARPEGTPRNVWPVLVGDLERGHGRTRLVLDGPVRLVAEVTDSAAAELGAAPGGSFWAALKATEIDVYPA